MYTPTASICCIADWIPAAEYLLLVATASVGAFFKGDVRWLAGGDFGGPDLTFWLFGNGSGDGAGAGLGMVTLLRVGCCDDDLVVSHLVLLPPRPHHYP